MTVRFKGQSEYQQSYRVFRSRSASPQHCSMLTGLNSDVTVSGSRVHHKETSAGQKQPKLLGALSNPRSPAECEYSAGHHTGPLERPERELPVGSVTDRKSVKPHPAQPSQPQPSKHVTGLALDERQPSVNTVDHVLKRRAGLSSGGQRSEFNRHFGWKRPVTVASPLLTAEQVLNSSNRLVLPLKADPVSIETEYQLNFQGLTLPTGPRLRKHLENQPVPLVHTELTNSKKEDSQIKPQPKQDALQRENTSQSPLKATPPPQVQRRRRVLTEYQSSFRSPPYRNSVGSGANVGVNLQVKELKEMAQLYRRRAWGTNFSRDHLGQLLSDNNTLWELTDTMDSLTDPPTPQLSSVLSPESDSSSTSCIEALDLISNSSKRSSVVDSGETYAHTKTQRDTGTKTKKPTSPLTVRRTAWEEEEEEEEEVEAAAADQKHADEEEGRLPTPRLKVKPVQRTHHDLTTPATGGAILVGNLKSGEGSTPNKQQRCGSAISTANGAESNMQAKHTEAWSEKIASPLNPSPKQKPASSPPSNRTKKAPPSPAAPPLLILPPQHGIQGTLRHPDFQHNGDLGLRFREPLCPGGGCGSDEDDRLSVMSWRSAASCSAASAVLERARRRRNNYWGKT